MNSSTSFFFFIFIFFIFIYSVFCVHNCPPSTCGNLRPIIQFPFRLADRQPYRCGYPDFDLSCNNQSQAIITFPASPGDFIVTRIDYYSQSIYINDPDFCLPERILKLNLRGSPFYGANSRDFVFLNCSLPEIDYRNHHAAPLLCLSGENFTVVAMMADDFSTHRAPPSCHSISIVSVPVEWEDPLRDPTDLRGDLQLTWIIPWCGSCAIDGSDCGFKGDSGLEITCSGSHSRGLPRSAKYGLVIGVGIPGLLCIIGFVFFALRRITNYLRRRRQLETEFLTGPLATNLAGSATGLDMATIESYPKIVIGENGQLPKLNDDKCCPICLSEYRPKETIRTIPDCNHFFHSHCIDEWLIRNATCPMCRNLAPENSSVVPISASRAN